MANTGTKVRGDDASLAALPHPSGEAWQRCHHTISTSPTRCLNCGEPVSLQSHFQKGKNQRCQQLQLHTRTSTRIHQVLRQTYMGYRLPIYLTASIAALLGSQTVCHKPRMRTWRAAAAPPRNKNELQHTHTHNSLQQHTPAALC
jgi:hypothetical protein